MSTGGTVPEPTAEQFPLDAFSRDHRAARFWFRVLRPLRWPVTVAAALAVASVLRWPEVGGRACFWMALPLWMVWRSVDAVSELAAIDGTRAHLTVDHTHLVVEHPVLLAPLRIPLDELAVVAVATRAHRSLGPDTHLDPWRQYRRFPIERAPGKGYRSWAAKDLTEHAPLSLDLEGRRPTVALVVRTERSTPTRHVRGYGARIPRILNGSYRLVQAQETWQTLLLRMSSPRKLADALARHGISDELAYDQIPGLPPTVDLPPSSPDP